MISQTLAEESLMKIIHNYILDTEYMKMNDFLS